MSVHMVTTNGSGGVPRYGRRGMLGWIPGISTLAYSGPKHASRSKAAS